MRHQLESSKWYVMLVRCYSSPAICTLLYKQPATFAVRAPTRKDSHLHDLDRQVGEILKVRTQFIVNKRTYHVLSFPPAANWTSPIVDCRMSKPVTGGVFLTPRKNFFLWPYLQASWTETFFSYCCPSPNQRGLFFIAHHAHSVVCILGKVKICKSHSTTRYLYKRLSRSYK